MKTFGFTSVLLACLLLSSKADATLTLQLDGNGVGPTTIADGSAFDIDGLVNGTITTDFTALPGWAGGTSFLVTADDFGSSGGRGQVNVRADYDFTGGSVVPTEFNVSASSLTTVAGAPIEFFRHSIDATGAGTLQNSRGFFSTAFSEPGPIDEFDFSSANTFNNSLSLIPPAVFSPFSGTVETIGGLGSFDTRVRVANTFTIDLNAGQVGSVSTSTIVNPEPASLLLSAFGAGLFGLGYRRKRQLQIEATS